MHPAVKFAPAPDPLLLAACCSPKHPVEVDWVAIIFAWLLALICRSCTGVVVVTRPRTRVAYSREDRVGSPTACAKRSAERGSGTDLPVAREILL